MRVIAIRTLKEFWEKAGNGDSEQSLRAWFAEAKEADWKSSNDIKERYHLASIIGNSRVVFNIKGNKYRLIVAIKFDFRLVYIRFVGTYKQYDSVNARTI